MILITTRDGTRNFPEVGEIIYLEPHKTVKSQEGWGFSFKPTGHIIEVKVTDLIPTSDWPIIEIESNVWCDCIWTIWSLTPSVKYGRYAKLYRCNV